LLFLDGVFVRDEDGALDFHELDEPSPEQVADVAGRTAKRVIKLLEKASKSLDPAFQDEHSGQPDQSFRALDQESERSDGWFRLFG